MARPCRGDAGAGGAKSRCDVGAGFLRLPPSHGGDGTAPIAPAGGDRAAGRARRWAAQGQHSSGSGARRPPHLRPLHRGRTPPRCRLGNGDRRRNEPRSIVSASRGPRQRLVRCPRSLPRLRRPFADPEPGDAGDPSGLAQSRFARRRRGRPRHPGSRRARDVGRRCLPHRSRQAASRAADRVNGSGRPATIPVALSLDRTVPPRDFRFGTLFF